MTDEIIIEIVEEEFLLQIVEETIVVSLDGDVVIHTTNFYSENLIGTIDNENTAFSTSFEFIPGSTLVFINGLKQKRGEDYEEVIPTNILMTDPPSNISFIDILEISYIRKN